MTRSSDASSAALALEEPLVATLDRWRSESSVLDRAGVYDWLTARITADRVLEIGCGFGLSTAALARGGKQVFALDNRLDCLEATQVRVPEATLGMADIMHYDDRLIGDLEAFEPRAVVCWLAGAPADALPRDVPAAYAVMQHRLQLQNAVIRMASRLASVQTVHLADRTAFPWKMKDAGRKTMAGMIVSAVIAESPFTLDETNVHFRKLEGVDMVVKPGAALAGVVPVVGEATLKRRHNVS
jgi:SAM-dependent methyltransferase